jgi:hypothetical protein
VSPSAAGFPASEPRKIKARRLFSWGGYHDQIGNPGQEVLTAHFFITQPHYLKWMLKLKEVEMRK